MTAPPSLIAVTGSVMDLIHSPAGTVDAQALHAILSAIVQTTSTLDVLETLVQIEDETGRRLYQDGLHTADADCQRIYLDARRWHRAMMKRLERTYRELCEGL